MIGTLNPKDNVLDMASGEFKRWALPHLATGTEQLALAHTLMLNYDPKIIENLGL